MLDKPAEPLIAFGSFYLAPGSAGADDKAVGTLALSITGGINGLVGGKVYISSYLDTTFAFTQANQGYKVSAAVRGVADLTVVRAADKDIVTGGGGEHPG